MHVVGVSSAEKADSGEDPQRTNQQQHWEAQVSSGSRVPKATARLQTGESWYPGDDAGFLETPAALPESLGLQLYCSSWRTLQMCAAGRQLPVSSVQCRRSPTEDCWSTSCTRSPTQRTTHECRLRSVHQPHRAAAKSKLWRSGDPGRATSTRMIYQTEFIMPVWDWHGLKLWRRNWFPPLLLMQTFNLLSEKVYVSLKLYDQWYLNRKYRIICYVKLLWFFFIKF